MLTYMFKAYAILENTLIARRVNLAGLLYKFHDIEPFLLITSRPEHMAKLASSWYSGCSPSAINCR
jgi:hypothetical protein